MINFNNIIKYNFLIEFNKYNNEYYIRKMLDYLNIYINMINNTN